MNVDMITLNIMQNIVFLNFLHKVYMQRRIVISHIIQFKRNIEKEREEKKKI